MAVLWSAPNVLWLASGRGEGNTEINAFDHALLDAGIGNLNLVRVSSVVPAGAQLTDQPLEITAGSLVPVVYSSMHSGTMGERICSAVGIGLSLDSHGMIFEHSANSADVAERTVRQMIEDAFGRRGLSLARTIVRSAEHQVERLGCTVAAAVLWWR